MKRIVYSIAVAAIALTACTKEYENTYILPQEGGGTYDQIGVALPEQTRTYLEGNDVLWEAGDKITAWSDYATSPVTFSLTGDDAISDGGKKALFTVGQGQGVKYSETATTNFYAIYPASTAQSISVPQNQSWKGFKNFYQNVNPMIAKSTDIDNMTFQNPCAILAFKLVAKTGNTATLSRIEVSSQSARLSGTATVNWADMTLQWTSVNYSVTLQGNNEVIPTDTNNPGVYYIVIPAGSYNDFTINVVYRSDKGRTYTKTRDVNNAMQIESGKIFAFNTVFELDTEDPKAPDTYAVGDLYPKTGTPQGVVFDVAADGLSGKIVALKDCETGGNRIDYEDFYFYNYKWGSFNAITSASNGLSNTNAMITAGTNTAITNALSTISVADDIQWYLPSENEFQTMSDQVGGFQAAAPLMGDNYWTSTIQRSRTTYLVYYSFNEATSGYGRKTVNVTSIASTLSDGASIRAIAQFVSK